jgi:UMF1 family MFS transporter
VKDKPKSIIAWSLYDWGNSAFATTVMAGFFPVFFKEFWSAGVSPQQSTFFLGLANSAASVLVALSAPIWGAVADRGGRRKLFLAVFCYLGVLATAALWLVNKGDWKIAAVLFVVGTVGFTAANIFYDALLVSVASPRKVDFVSSLGFSLGYAGGGLLFFLNVVMYLKPALFGFADGSQAVRFSFLTVALWWFLFSLPLLFWVREDRLNAVSGFGKAVKAGFSQLAGTLKQFKTLKSAGWFLLAYWFYIDGVDTVIKMAVDYGSSLGFPAASLIVALLIVQFIAFPAALLYNLFAKKIGVRRALITAIIAYCIITVLAFFMAQTWHFFVLAGVVGLFQGGIQALSRSYFSRMIPAGQEGEFFGFYDMFGKFATVFGPLLMGLVTLLTGSNRFGILSIIILFGLGLLFFSRVKDPVAEV